MESKIGGVYGMFLTGERIGVLHNGMGRDGWTRSLESLLGALHGFWEGIPDFILFVGIIISAKSSEQRNERHVMSNDISVYWYKGQTIWNTALSTLTHCPKLRRPMLFVAILPIPLALVFRSIAGSAFVAIRRPVLEQ